MTLLRVSLLVACFTAACGDEGRVMFTATPDASMDGGADAGDDALVMYEAPPPVDRGPLPDAQEPAGMVVVYAHADDVLFAVDPASRSVRRIGSFAFPMDGNNHSMTDLAVDSEGRITGVTQDALYSIDPNNAACTLVRALPTTDRRVFVGLTWVPVGVLNPSAEVLLGGATDGTLWRIDPATGRTTMVGTLPNNMGISGDMVSIRGAATYATVRPRTGTSTSDTLATLDLRSGVRMTNVGQVGFRSIYGLGYWRATLYGFTRAGELITISPTNGRGTRVSMPAMEFSGAGVTTIAPTAPP